MENTAAQMRDTVQNGEPGQSKYRYVVEVIIFLTYACFGMSWASCGAFFKEIMAELSLTVSQASFLTTSVSIAKIFGPFLAGAVLARAGLRWAFMAASVLICMGVLAPFATTYEMLLLARFCMGIGGAMVVVYFTPLAMQWFSGGERIIVNGFNSISVNTGVMVALFATTSLMGTLGGWRNILIFYSIGSVVLAMAWLAFGREKQAPGDPGAPGAPGAVGGPRKKSGIVAGYKIAVSDRNTWALAFGFVGILTAYLVLFTYFPTFYRNVFGLDSGSFVFYAPAIAMCAGIPASLLVAYVTKRTGRRLPLLRWPGIIFVLAVLGMIYGNAEVILVSSVLTGACLLGTSTLFYIIPQELPGQTVEKAGYMMVVFWAVTYVASTFNVWLMGKIIDMTGSFASGLVIAAVMSSTAFLSSFLLPETGSDANNQG